MRKTVRAFSQLGPTERVARAIANLPPAARLALCEVAAREDLPLVAGVWDTGDGGCLVANVLRAVASDDDDGTATLDVRILKRFPEMSSRDMNHLIVAWDEAAAQQPRADDATLRKLLRDALASAGVRPAVLPRPSAVLKPAAAAGPELAAAAAAPEPAAAVRAELGYPESRSEPRVAVTVSS